jgi:hypothetical protein
MKNQRSDVRGRRSGPVVGASHRVHLLVLALCMAIAPLPSPAQDGGQRTSVARLTPDVKKAITRGLDFLAKAQNEDGSFGKVNRTGGTSLALMSFMVQGHVPGEGTYGKAMDMGIDFLISVEKNGYVHDDTSRGMYEHGLAVLALSEAWGQSQDPRIREALIRAVNVTINAQNSEGGWRYGPRPTSADVSCAAMQMVALASAAESGIAVPEKTMQRAVDYVVSAEVRSTGGFSYQVLAGAPMGAAGFARSAAGTLALMLCGQHKHPATRGGVAYINGIPKVLYEDGANYYYGHYYAAQAMYQAGDKYFNNYYPEIAKVLVEKQAENGAWGDNVVDTGFAILTLGVPYRFLPIYQK